METGQHCFTHPAWRTAYEAAWQAGEFDDRCVHDLYLPACSQKECVDLYGEIVTAYAYKKDQTVRTA